MRTLTCMAVDDNQDALDMLALRISESTHLKMIHSDLDPQNALRLLQEKKLMPDILFLDIKMPGCSGIEFSERIKGPWIIFTTAYRQYWSEALDQEATVHYLLKPILRDKFDKAITKARLFIEQNIKPVTIPPPKILAIPGNGKQDNLRIPTGEIVYCIASRNYTDFYMENGKKITTFLTLKAVEELLVKPWYARIQRSYFVNVDKVTRVDANHVYIGDELELPIGQTYKPKLIGVFD